MTGKKSTSGENTNGETVNDKKTVLLVSLFHPELVRGGAQQVCYELFEGLRGDAEYRPVLLASIDANYPALYKSGARITGFDERPDEFLFLSRDYDHWWHRTSDPLLVESYTDFLEQTRPDVVHFHHFLTYGVELISLTRRVLPEARLVLTFHEFLAICNANGHMVRRFDNSLCRTASQVRCHQCFPERSPEDFFVRKLWLQSHLGAIDAFTCPSRFMLDHYADWGIERDKLFHVTNGQRDYAEAAGAQAPARNDTREKHNRFGFFGQIVDAKGVHIVLRAVELLRAEGFTDFAVEINGGNLNFASPEVRGEIEQFIEAEKERPSSERLVWFNGSYETRELRSRMTRIDWCIVPSLWWEAFALVISEAWMFKKPVICSNVGAMADRVTDEKDGLHFEMGDAAALARTIKRAASEPGLWQRLAGAVPTPPSRSEMVEGFRRIYRGEPAVAAEATDSSATTKMRSAPRQRAKAGRASPRAMPLTSAAAD
jgi:glycosyltransferase involved in cell wall biosynthesis